MRWLLVFVALALIAVIYTPPDLYPFASVSAKSAPIYALYAPFTWLPNGSGRPLGTAFALGLLLVAILLPKKESRRQRRGKR